jgi:ssDNA-binding Zn-finger/Zn-ribbon topoisomerase 1
MTKKTLLTIYLSSLILIFGCQQQEKKPASLVQDIKEKQAQQIKNSIAATCEGCYGWLDLYFTDRDIVIARNPGIEQNLYLTVVDDEGVPVTCCKKAMQLRVGADGKLFLYCKTCGKLKPVAVKNGKVVVVEDSNNTKY